MQPALNLLRLPSWATPSSSSSAPRLAPAERVLSRTRYARIARLRTRRPVVAATRGTRDNSCRRCDRASDLSRHPAREENGGHWLRRRVDASSCTTWLWRRGVHDCAIHECAWPFRELDPIRQSPVCGHLFLP